MKESRENWVVFYRFNTFMDVYSLLPDSKETLQHQELLLQVKCYSPRPPPSSIRDVARAKFFVHEDAVFLILIRPK